MRSLSDLAKQGGRAVIASLQQPRAEIFEALDQILLLGKGGTVVYFGPASECVASLAVQGLDIDPKDYDNPGDFIIDAVGLDPERDSNAGGGEENSTERPGREEESRAEKKQHSTQQSQPPRVGRNH